jgi:hypothetical protein
MLNELTESVKKLSGSWASYSALGSFVLYVCGYLALRFHLTMLGIATDLTVVDERYLFTGARFLVYLTTSVPKIILVAVPLSLVIRLLGNRARTWLSQPSRLLAFSIIFSVLTIQLVMVQCFFLSDLLLAPRLPSDPAWLVALLFNSDLLPLYFSGLVASCLLTLAILIYLRSARGPAYGVALFLAAVQLLLLPVNYGVLIVDKTLPRVAGIGNEPLASGQTAWLAWEGKDHMTFLLRDNTKRTLLTVDGAEIKRVEVIGADPIIPTLFGK